MQYIKLFFFLVISISLSCHFHKYTATETNIGHFFYCLWRTSQYSIKNQHSYKLVCQEELYKLFELFSTTHYYSFEPSCKSGYCFTVSYFFLFVKTLCISFHLCTRACIQSREVRSDHKWPLETHADMHYNTRCELTYVEMSIYVATRC